MQKKQMLVVPQSMQQDIAVSQFPNNAAYELRNMRIVSTGDNTTLCLTNEKSNLDTELQIEGTILGIQVIKTPYTINGEKVIKDCAIVFSKNSTVDTIGMVSLINESGESLVYEELFSGNLNFSVNAPIESIGIYETDSIQKVYWVDGINQPRVINISKEGREKISLTNNTQFDFLPNISDNNNLSVNIEKIKFNNGNFPAGMVQYAISYFNKYAQQTGIVYQSPLLYTSSNNRGLSAEDKSSDVFKISMSGLNRNFEYVRLYRITRTSLDDTPTVNIVGDYKIGDTFNVESNTIINSSNSGKIVGLTYDVFSAGSLASIFAQENKSRLLTNDSNPYAMVINQLPTTGTDSRQDFKIKYVENNITYEYTIPKDVSVWLEWTYAVDKGDLSKEYKIGAAVLENTWRRDDTYIIKGVQVDGGTIIDTGTSVSIVDPTELLFLGGEPIHPSTIAHKDNTLFLGNFSLERKTISSQTKKDLQEHSTVRFEYLDTNSEDNIKNLETQYLYKSTLDKPSNSTTYFQKGETYRVGIQFLHNTGSWSEVVFLGDYENPLRVIPNKYNDDIKSKPVLKILVDTPDLIKEGYIAARPVCVYPSIQDRTVLCQGLTLPTVYNVADRLDNSPYVQASWFARPNYYKQRDFDDSFMSIDNRKLYRRDLRGFPLEYRMSNYKNCIINLPASLQYNSEIQYGYDILGTRSASPYLALLEDSKADRLYNISHWNFGSTNIDYLNNFGVDKTVVTFHSPELDNNYDESLYNISFDNVKYRIVGYVPVKTTLSDLKLEVENPFNPSIGKFYWSQIEDKSTINNISGLSLATFPFWVDSVASSKNAYQPEMYDGKYWYSAFPIYAWHRSGSLNNQGKIDNTGNKKSVLKHKVLSNLRIGAPTMYLSEDYNDLDISNIELFNSDNIEVKKINAWGKELLYYGNIDKILVSGNSDTNIWSTEAVGSISDKEIVADTGSDKISPLDLVKDGSMGSFTSIATHIKDGSHTIVTEPVPIKYKSTPHAVFAFNKDRDGYYTLLPCIEGLDDPASLYNESYINTFDGLNEKNLLWEDQHEEFIGFKQHTIVDRQLDEYIDSQNSNKFYFILGEFYRDKVINRFGGTSEMALLNNIWTPCGETVYFNLNEDSENLVGDQGDTYYQRYDHLKTYPYAENDVNSVVDIVSFCCETRINIDGRYDRNRGLQSNVHITPNNFNLYNKVYSQRNNFFTYKSISNDDFVHNTFPTQITWSKTKTYGETVDTWTNITLASILDLDGDKGELQALRKFNNDIYAFQDSGISKILYNNRVQINASDGIPIEIANSGKVSGKVYLSSKYGCQDKWSIAKTPSGIYFVDNINQGILAFNGENIVDLTYTKYMYSWISKNISLKHWLPDKGGAIRTLYDRNNSDVYFTTNREALSFNEKLGSFSSFYDYNHVDWLINLEGNAYQVRNSKFWKLHGGENYNTFFGNRSPYDVCIIANPEFQQDKIFDTIEFRTNGDEAFSYGRTSLDNYPFNSLYTYTDYQFSKQNILTLRKKFRVWRWGIGRNSTNRDRIRDMWAKITMRGASTQELRLYDMAITYYT